MRKKEKIMMNPPTCAVLLLMCSLGVGAMDQEYCELTPKHTMCRYKGAGPACGPLEDRGLSEKESMEIVDYHNRLVLKKHFKPSTFFMVSINCILITNNKIQIKTKHGCKVPFFNTFHIRKLLTLYIF